MNTNTNKENHFVNVTETAELLKLSPRTVYRLVSDKRMPLTSISARFAHCCCGDLFLCLDALTHPAEPISIRTLVEIREGSTRQGSVLRVSEGCQ
jgi:Helix-turn-helix domain